MVTVIFVDGTSVEFEAGSNSISLVKKVSTLAELDSIRGLFTQDNIEGMQIDGVSVDNVVPVGMTIASTPADATEITAVFTNRAKTDLEILQEEQEAQNEMIDFLTMNM